MTIAALLASPIAVVEHADAVLELAFLVSAADGHLADEELLAFRQLVGCARGREATQDDVDGLLGRFIVGAQTTRVEDRVRDLAKNIPAELRETAFKVAVGLSLVDHDESEHEDELVGILAATLGLAERSIPIAEEARVAVDR